MSETVSVNVIQSKEESRKIDPDLENLYMPSNWVVRVKPEQSVPLHVKITSNESQRVKRDVFDKKLGVKYGPGETDIVDIFGEDGNRSGKVMVYISGGYWQELSGDISSYTVQPLVNSGHTCLVVHYTRCPGQNLEGIISQLVRFGKWLLEYARSKKMRVFLSGHSAGSHLCAMFLTSDWFQSLSQSDRHMFSGVVHLAGVFDLKPIMNTSINIPKLELDDSNVEKMSPLSDFNLVKLYSNSLHMRHWIIVGEHDSPAFKKQAENYFKSLKKGSLNVTMTE